MARGRKTGGRQKGTPNKDKPFKAALQAELAEAGADGPTLRKVARALLEQAASGNARAIREVADRLDGKVPQAIGGVDADENLATIAPVINLTYERPGPLPAPKQRTAAVDGLRKRRD